MLHECATWTSAANKTRTYTLVKCESRFAMDLQFQTDDDNANCVSKMHVDSISIALSIYILGYTIKSSDGGKDF